VKFNLKNRPRGQEGMMGYDSFDYKAVKEWFEGFEKELREWKIHLPPKSKGALEVIEEILGE